MTQLRYGPPAGLIMPAPGTTKDKSAPDFSYSMFGDDWVAIQTYVTSTLKLPINVNLFTDKYGKFDQKKDVEDVLKAIKEVQGMSTRFGDPVAITNKLKQDPRYLTGATAPNELFAHNIWMAHRIQAAADLFVSRQELLKKYLTGSGDTKTKAALTRDVLTSQHVGLKKEATALRAYLDTLVKESATFTSDFNKKNEQLKDYASKQSKIYGDAKAARAKFEKDAQELQRFADEAYSEWKKLTIAAIATSVGLTIISLGMAVGIAEVIGIVLGVLATKARKRYNQFLDQVATAKVEEQKKILLLSDLDGLHSQLTPLTGYTGSFLKKAQTILGVWDNVGAALGEIAKLEDKDLSDYDELEKIIAMEDGKKQWQNVSDATKWFTMNSLVSPDFKKWGTKLEVPTHDRIAVLV